MPDRFSDRSADHPSEDELHAHAAYRAEQSASGIGAAVARSGSGGQHVWECIVSDGEEWHFISVQGAGLDATFHVPSEYVEDGIERFAATLPESYRLRALVNANPLHIDQSGTVTD